MKELFEEKMTSKFREVLENYEPAYSPQAWEKLSLQLPVKVPFRRRFFKWYFGLALCLLTIGVFTLHNRKTGDQINQLIQETETTKNEPDQNQSNTNNPSLCLDSKSGIKNNLYQNEVKPSGFVNGVPSGDTSLPDNTFQEKKLNQLDPLTNELRSNTNINNVLQESGNNVNPYNNKTKKRGKHSFRIKDYLPEISFKSNEWSSYSNFIGPTQFALFYNPEVHSISANRHMRLSQGIGIEFEGPLSTFLSVAGGVSYQSNGYSRRISRNELLLPPNIRLTNNIYNDEKSQFTEVTDSVTNRSIAYQFLEVPVSLKLALFQSNRSKIILDAGVSAIFFLNEKYVTPFSNQERIIFSEERTFTPFENIHPLGSFNTGLSYRYLLGKRLSFFGSLQYKINLTPFGGNELKIDRLSSQFGFIYRFGRKE